MIAIGPKRYDEFVFFSAGPVGDHAIIIDWANRFYESTGRPSRIIMKHPNAFLRDMAIPYYDHISYLEFKGVIGRFKVSLLSLTSIWKSRCYILILPIPPPLYLKVFAQFIRFFTISRMVALDSPCGFSLLGGPFPSAQFVGKGNYIDGMVDKNLYYEQANRMLSFLGYKIVARVPEIKFIDTPSTLEKYNLTTHNYLAMHLCSAGVDRSFPVDRWQHILVELRKQLPQIKFVFTGGPADRPFIEEAVSKGSKDNSVIICGEGVQELLTIYAHAKLTVTVHTGNAMLINMLHIPAVIINIKGIYSFKYYYNKKGIELVSTVGCTCHPYERSCSMVKYKGVDYMSCLFNISDEEVIDTVVSKYNI